MYSSRVLLIMLGISLYAGGLAQPAVASDYVYIDDGESYVIGDATYKDSSVILDYHVANTPGTHFQIVNGGNIWHIGTLNNSTVTVDGGLISSGINANNNSEIVVNGGTVGAIWSHDHASVTVNGGAIGGIATSSDSIVELRGGAVGHLRALGSATIYLYGRSFSIGGVELNYGDSLSNYGVALVGENELRGTITGTLLDGSLLNSEFIVPLNNPGGADIIVIPEPATSTLLLTAGVFLLRRKR
jgi:hypothetical protein